MQHELLPLFFRTPPLPGGEDSKEGSKNGSIGRRDSKRMSSLKRRVSGKEVNLTRIDSKKRWVGRWGGRKEGKEGGSERVMETDGEREGEANGGCWRRRGRVIEGVE